MDRKVKGKKLVYTSLMEQKIADTPSQGPLNPNKVATWPRIFSSTTEITGAVHRAVARGEIVKIGPRLYTTEVEAFAANPKGLIRRNLLPILEAYVPGGVISDRSAATPGFVVEDTIFLVSDKGEKTIALPGLKIQVRSGKAAVPGDTNFGSTNLNLASPTRTLLENQLPSRKRGLVSSRLTVAEQEEYLERLLRTQGRRAIERIADSLKDVAATLDLAPLVPQAQKLARTFLGTVQVSPKSQVLKARQKGSPYDPIRIELFASLAQGLLHHDHVYQRSRPVAALQELPFFEAYFSNFIEGTEFVLEEAKKIVAEGILPASRSSDAHDILSTYELVSDWKEMSRTPKTAEEFSDLLRDRHARLLAYRPETTPGIFKEAANRVGLRQFVAPDLVTGTLHEAFKLGEILQDPWARAVFLSFVVAEVHPFNDGNGRLSRIMLNAELTAASEERVIIPTVYRDNYLSSLRALSSGNGPRAWLRSLEFAQTFTAQTPWRTYESARRALEESHAFLTDAEATELGVKLTLPGELKTL
ncbi:MAG: Fic family protein [Nitrososphaerales archaeon]